MTSNEAVRGARSPEIDQLIPAEFRMGDRIGIKGDNTYSQTLSELVTSYVRHPDVVRGVELAKTSIGYTKPYSENSFETYMDETASFDLLSREAEVGHFVSILSGVEAFLTAKASDDPDLHQMLKPALVQAVISRQVVYASNTRLVISVAKKMRKGDFSMPELVSTGNLGLVRAIEKFDYRKGFKFSTYASHWIGQTITRYVHTSIGAINVPEDVGKAAARISPVIESFRQAHDRYPTKSELRAEAGVKDSVGSEKFENVLPLSLGQASLEDPIPGTESMVVGDRLADDDSMAYGEQMAEAADIRKTLGEWISQAKLDCNELLVLCAICGINDLSWIDGSGLKSKDGKELTTSDFTSFVDDERDPDDEIRTQLVYPEIVMQLTGINPFNYRRLERVVLTKLRGVKHFFEDDDLRRLSHE